MLQLTPGLIPIASIAFSAAKTALPATLAFMAFTNAEKVEETETKKIKNNESLTNDQITAIYLRLTGAYQRKSKELKYDDFKIHESIPVEPKKMLDFVGSNIPSNKIFDPYNNTPLTRLVANQKFGLIEGIMNEVGDQELLKAHPDLTKRFLNSCDNKGINFLEMSSRFYGIMPEKLLKKVVSLYAENAEPESIKLTPAILSLPEPLFNSLSGKIDKTNKEEFTKPSASEKEIYKKIVASRKEVGLSPLAIYVKEGYENSVVVNFNPVSDGLPDQADEAGGGKVTNDPTFKFLDTREGTIASKKLAQMGEAVIREKFTRNDLTPDHKEAIITALKNGNLTATRMAEDNAKSNIQNLSQLNVCSTGVYNPKAQGIFNSYKYEGFFKN